ncbi:MAG TPA: hypothetical protein VGU64_02195 [Terriglobales bacterium]|nr:hypothetical protein [Terriglobales bacterium]
MPKYRTALGLGFCGMLLLSEATNCHPITLSPVADQFMLGYVTGATSPLTGHVVVRWALSAPSLDWKDGSFPTGVHPGSGVGIMAGRDGLFRLALTDIAPSQIEMVWGLGPAIWDNSGLTPAAAPPASSPVGVALDDDSIFAIAYTRSGSTVAVELYKHDTRSFVADLAPQGGTNTNVEGRPDMVRQGNTVVLVWRRWNGSTFDLVTSKGTVTGQTLVFSPGTVLPTPTDAQLAAGVESDPAVARTDTKFFVAAVREEVGGGAGTLHGWRTQVFESPDGVAWTSNAVMGSLDVVNVSQIGLAGVGGGKVIAVGLKQTTGGNAKLSGAVFDGTSWQAMPTSELNGMTTSTPSFRPFALIGVMKNN